MIISASRRTDIPAFYHEWFINRIRAGFLLVRNPYNYNQIKRISLLPSDVDAIVFWTRNPERMLLHIDELNSRGYRYYFQYTITGYPKILDRHGLNPHKSLEIFTRLSKALGSNKVIWRYDPILLSNITPLDEHKRLFYKIASNLAGKTHRVVISFADLYNKTVKNLNASPGLIYQDITSQNDELMELCAFFSQVSKSFDLDISTCAEELDLHHCKIRKGKCIDDELLKEVFGLHLSAKKDQGQREACGCIKSVDIGHYNTCLHGCTYCYANYNDKTVRDNRAKHDPESPFLLGGTEGVDNSILLNLDIQQRLF